MSETNDAGTLYRKVGRRYEPVDTAFLSRPAPGVWIVQPIGSSWHQMRIAKVGELPDPMPVAALYRHWDVAITALLDCFQTAVCPGGAVSLQEMLTAVFLAIAKAEAEAERGVS